jgi:hypothetical protein
MEYLIDDWLREWARTHCKTKEELEKERIAIEKEATNIFMNKIDGVEITTEPIIFDAKEFSSSRAFASAIFMSGKHYADTDDIIVRYTKPENKETHEVSIQFHILKSKAKVFQKYMRENNTSFEFVLSSSNEIKSCVKLLNSLGVKGEGGEPLSSKETDYARDMKDSFKNGENKVYVFAKYDKNNNAVLLYWNLVNIDYVAPSYNELKTNIDFIIKT